jgi:hypothetical protein
VLGSERSGSVPFPLRGCSAIDEESKPVLRPKGVSKHPPADGQCKVMGSLFSLKKRLIN